MEEAAAHGSTSATIERWREPRGGEPLIGRRIRTPEHGTGVVWSVGAGWILWQAGPGSALVGKRIRLHPAAGVDAPGREGGATWREAEVLQQHRKLLGPDQHLMRFDSSPMSPGVADAASDAGTRRENRVLVRGDEGLPVVPFEVLHTGPHVISVQYDGDPGHTMHALAIGTGLHETAGVQVCDSTAGGSFASGAEEPDCTGFVAHCGPGVVHASTLLEQLAGGVGAAFNIPPMQLVPLTQLMQLRRFPRPDEVVCLQCGELAAIAGQMAEGQARVVFVSHTWPHPTVFPDTADHSQAACLLEHLRTLVDCDRVYLFIDCSCTAPLLPAGSGTVSPLRRSQLLALPVYLRCASDFVCILESDGRPGPWCHYELQNFSTVRIPSNRIAPSAISPRWLQCEASIIVRVFLSVAD